MGSGLAFNKWGQVLPFAFLTNLIQTHYNFIAKMKVTQIFPILRMRFCHAPLAIYKKKAARNLRH